MKTKTNFVTFVVESKKKLESHSSPKRERENNKESSFLEKTTIDLTKEKLEVRVTHFNLCWFIFSFDLFKLRFIFFCCNFPFTKDDFYDI